MPYFTYDTSVIIARRSIVLRPTPGGLVLSSVVLMELTASAIDDSQRKVYEFLFREHQQNKSLLVPNDNDWFFASKVLFWLARRRRKVQGGSLRRLQPGMAQRMAFDALLAASARSRQVAVVTENWNDFKAIQRFCNVKLIKASDFFG
jgi:predicted nucleic acid-binding protein